MMKITFWVLGAVIIGFAVGHVVGEGHRPIAATLHDKERHFIIGYAPRLKGEAARSGNERKLFLTFQNKEDYDNAIQLIEEEADVVFNIMPSVRKHLEKARSEPQR
jgi:hypothetical protein